MRKLSPIITGGLLQCTNALAEPIRVCVSDQPAAPFTWPDREGISHKAIRAAAGHLGRKVEFQVKPRVRCLMEIKSGQVDALAMAGSTAELTAELAFPRQGQAIDVQRGFGPYRAFLVRYRGATLEWDGKKLSGANLPVLYPAGMTVARAKLIEVGATPSDMKSVKAMAFMLQNKRAQAAVMREADALPVAHESGLELVQPAFVEINIYVPFSRAYYDANKDFVEAFWNQIGQQRK